jgi:hypothetical protein
VEVVLRSGVWLPDELAVLRTALGLLKAAPHDGVTDQEFETLIVADLMQSARDGCHDARELARRCRTHIKSELAIRTARSTQSPRAR